MDVILKGKTKDDYQVLYAALLDSEPSHYNFPVAMKILTMVFIYLFMINLFHELSSLNIYKRIYKELYFGHTMY